METIIIAVTLLLFWDRALRDTIIRFNNYLIDEKGWRIDPINQLLLNKPLICIDCLAMWTALILCFVDPVNLAIYPLTIYVGRY